MKKRGFTLVELLAVIAILAILVIMALPAVLRMFEQARVDSFNNELNTIVRTAKQQYLLEGGEAKTWSNAEGSTSKLSLTGNSELKYLVTMDGNGKITKLQATNGSYQYNETNENGIDIVDKTDVEATSNLSESEKLVITLDDEGSGDEPVASDELVFNDQSKTIYYSTSAKNSSITYATNGSGTYTYSIVSQKKSGGTTVSYFSIITSSGSPVIYISASTPVSVYTVVLKATDTESGKTKEATYTITIQYPALYLNGNGGSVTRSTVYPKYGTTDVYTTPTGSTTATISATRSGYTLDGWYASSTGGPKVLDASGNGTGTAVSGYIDLNRRWVMTGNMILYAKWTSNASTTATVTYNCNGGSGTAPTTITVQSGSSAPLTGNLTCGPKIVAGSGTGTSGSSGVFYQAGWSTTTGGSALSSYTVNGSTTLYAVWNKMFTYTSTYNIINDGNGNWRAKLLSNGTLTALTPVAIDAFLVGGGGSGAPGKPYSGGGGGGGGYTLTQSNITLVANSSYAIEIGIGGQKVQGTGNDLLAGNDGGNTKAFGYTANGGKGGVKTTGNYAGTTGGNGGSGGGGGSYDTNNASNGGYYGGNGGGGCSTSARNGCPGTGQGSTTCEFGQGTTSACNSGVTAYAGGGGGGAGNSGSSSWGTPGVGGNGGGGAGGVGNSSEATAGVTNTGGGGGGGSAYYNSSQYAYSGAGGSGIVIIRNKR